MNRVLLLTHSSHKKKEKKNEGERNILSTVVHEVIYILYTHIKIYINL